MPRNHAPLASHALTLPRPHRRLRILAAVLVFLLGLVTCLGWFVYADVASWGKKVDLADLLGQDRVTDAKPKDSFANKDLNVLVIGSDYRRDTEYDENGNPVTGMRSDTTMMVHISANRTRVDVMSIPRDLMVRRPECTFQDGTTESASRGDVQFNSVFALMGRETDVAAAVACTIKTIEDFTNIYIDEFAVIDFDGFEEMVAALGGVNLCLDEAVSDPITALQLSAGCHLLNPREALMYARARYGLGDGSDISRIGRQQQLLGAMFKDVKKRNLFTNMPALYAFLRAGMKSVTTSPSFGAPSNLGGLALSLAGLKPKNIHFYTLPFTDYLPDPARVALADNANKMFEALREDKPVPSIFPYQDLNGNRVEATPSGSPQVSQSSTGDSARVADSASTGLEDSSSADTPSYSEPEAGQQ